MHELKGDLAVVRYAGRRVEKALTANESRITSFLNEFRIDIGSRALP
jgi:hypothetical protein